MARSKRRSAGVQAVDIKSVSRRKNEIDARYDAAAGNRRLRGWKAPASGPQSVIAQVPVVRNRARDAVRNEWQSTASLDIKVSSWVGVGITPRPKAKAARVKAVLTELWDEWVPVADADGVSTYYGLQALAARARSEGGEVFIRARYRRPEDGLPVPIQFQLLEAEMLPLLDADSWPGLPAGHRIRQGVELDRIGRRAAYWFFRSHPGDGETGNADLVRVPATDVCHLFKPLRPGQLRGIPDSAPGLARLRVVTDFDDAVLARQHAANLYAGFIKKPMPTTEGDIDPETGRAIELDTDDTPMVALEPGTMQELAPGEDVVFADPPDAGTKYAEFMRWQNLGVAAGEGVPYELMTGDLMYIQDRVLRVAINEFRRRCEQHQWHTIIPGVCEFIRNKWADAALLAGVLNEKQAKEAKRTEWAPHAWAYMHPTQDVQAKLLEIQGGLRSRSAFIAERGDDPVAVDEERAEEIEREKAAGLSSGAAPGAAPGGQAPAKSDTPPEKTPAAKAIEWEQVQSARHAAASAQAHARTANAEAERAERALEAERARLEAETAAAAALRAIELAEREAQAAHEAAMRDAERQALAAEHKARLEAEAARRDAAEAEASAARLRESAERLAYETLLAEASGGS